MKTIGQKCGWVIPRKERRVLKLLRERTRELDHKFVATSRTVPRRQTAVRIRVEFASEELSAFQAPVHITIKA